MNGDAMKSTTETQIAILRNRIQAASEARNWCRANGRSQGPTSRIIFEAIQELKALEGQRRP